MWLFTVNILLKMRNLMKLQNYRNNHNSSLDKTQTPTTHTHPPHTPHHTRPTNQHIKHFVSIKTTHCEHFVRARMKAQGMLSFFKDWIARNMSTTFSSFQRNPRLPKGWLPPPWELSSRPAEPLVFVTKWLQVIVGSFFAFFVVILGKKIQLTLA